MKALLLDADGVVLKKDEYFSDKFAREHNVPSEDIVKFFRGPFGDCQAGIKDLREEITPCLERWGWKGDVDDFLEYWFQDVVIDPEIESVLEQCRVRNISSYMASNNEHYRARRIEEVLGNRLTGYFFSADLKVKKEDPTYFISVLESLRLPANEVGFVDNEQKNIVSAERVGINARLFSETVWSDLFSEKESNSELKNNLK